MNGIGADSILLLPPLLRRLSLRRLKSTVNRVPSLRDWLDFCQSRSDDTLLTVSFNLRLLWRWIWRRRQIQRQSRYDTTPQMLHRLCGTSFLRRLKSTVNRVPSLRDFTLIIFISLFAFNFAFGQELIRKQGANGKWGFVDKTEKEVIPFKYDGVMNFTEDLALVKLNNKQGFIDKTGNEVVPLIYDYAESFSEGLALVLLNEKCGFIDKMGNEVIPLIYDYTDSYLENLLLFIEAFRWEYITKGFYSRSFSEGLASVLLNGKMGFIDKKGNEVIPLKYDYASCFSEGLARVSLNNKSGFIDRIGNEIIPLKYDKAGDFTEGLALVKIGNKQGFIDKTGKVVIPLKYNNGEDFSKGLASVELDGKWGFINKKGKEVVPIKYVSYDDAYAEAKKIRDKQVKKQKNK